MMGRPTIFGRANGKRVQGVLTAEGTTELEHHRTALALLYRQIVGRKIVPSDANTLEFALRGERKTIAYLKQLKAQQ